VTQRTSEGTQVGSNAAYVWQYGVDTTNTSDILQDGFANTVVVWQSGVDISNNSTVSQTGQLNNATVDQR
jgi:hypothetical protein